MCGIDFKIAVLFLPLHFEQLFVNRLFFNRTSLLIYIKLRNVKMGSSLQKQTKRINHPPQVVLMGLDSAGKSTLLYRLHQGVVMGTSPTIGFNVVTLELDKKTLLTIWDVGGQKNMRDNWRYYLEDCKALVFVVDASDGSRMEEAKMALRNIIKNDNLTGVPLMVLANKIDLPNSMTITEVAEHLDLQSSTDFVWEIQGCSALKGQGLHQAFQSVAKMIQDK